MFQNAMNRMFDSNAKVDFSLPLAGEYHFDNEAFQAGREIITRGMSAVKANVKAGSFIAARESLGQISHILQDFYSHSNWVELGKSIPYSALIRADQPLENLAGPDTPTCKSCAGQTCSDNILPEVLQKGLLTSGYFDIFSSDKPAGKCSHGGLFDLTSKTNPVGGINKDAVESGHGSYHQAAVDLAVDATSELLEDIRVAVGDKNFLRLLGFTQSSALCFVIDTTGSMGDDIESVKSLTAKIIDERRGTPLEPSEYILVPFNDPDFGPVTKTTDADLFKNMINSLIPHGGGDIPEMSMSGLQLALTSAPASSDIHLFTDAPAKDSELKSAVTALIETTKSTVTFWITNVFSSRRRRSSDSQASVSRISLSDTQLYRDLAQASGGQAIEVSKLEISSATIFIEDSSARAVVTVFQVAMNPGKPENFHFVVDASLSNMFIYITGDSSLTFNLTSSTGVSQISSESSGPLASATRVGNLWRISLNTENQTGSWKISVNANTPYTVKITGQSSVNFVYNLVDSEEGAHGGVSPKNGRPITDGNVTLLVTVTGSDTGTVTEVTLFDSSVPTEVNGTIQSLGNGNFLVRFNKVPGGSYVVRLRGEDPSSLSRSTPTSFQRQASTQIKTSRLSVSARSASIRLEPGSENSISFTVSSEVPGTFSVQTNNDRSFPSMSPSSLSIAAGDGGQANGTIILTVPAGTASGTDVSLTIDVKNADGTDINYAVLRFSVAAKETDLSAPVCQVVNVSGICPALTLLCASVQWEFIANFTDGINGTGIATITLRQGNGTLNTSTVVGEGGENVTVITYSSSCCSQTVQVAAVDRVGNVGMCTEQARALTTPAPTTPVTSPGPTTPVTTPNVTTGGNNTTSTGGHRLSTSQFLWLTAVIYLLWK
ncbi:von Willebrand factor A domain-containing protein 7 isoform X2 [Kryptolebias marmoratus]|nr:von Willebrand factor A domain-containing protein 7 isoform X2 [Kryptolebias marmoratus]